jgi:hypothetical protein
MANRWTPDRVVALAPDSSSEVAGRKLGTPKPWKDVGWADPLLWGSCQGSGKTPYTVAIDTSTPSYKCSCPSRKFPCKHVLGLLFLWAQGNVDEGGVRSTFADEWAQKRGRSEEGGSLSSATPAERTPEQLAAAQARAEQRQANVAAGLADLDRWLADQFSAGLAHTGMAAMEQMAARLVDAQAPAVASRLRELASVPRGSRTWLDDTFSEFGRLHLLCRANALTAPVELRETIRQRIGYTVPREEVLATPPVADHWAVVGMRDSQQEQVSVRRVWLRGIRSGRSALVLFFTPRGQVADASMLPGSVVDADLHFYPGRPPLRAAVGQRRADPPRTPWHPAPQGVTDAIAEWRSGLAADPWLTEWPVAITGRLGSTDDGWALVDDDGTVALVGSDVWQVLARTGGAPTTIFGELNGTGLRPTALLVDGEVVPL